MIIPVLAVLVLVGALAIAVLRRKMADNDRFAPVARVVITKNHPWAPGESGTVARAPQALGRLAADWDGATRVVHTPKGDHTTYWIEFDRSQRDSEGDGPIVAAEVDTELLAALEDSGPPPPAERPEKMQFLWYENQKLGLRVEFRAKALGP